MDGEISILYWLKCITINVGGHFGGWRFVVSIAVVVAVAMDVYGSIGFSGGARGRL